MTRDDARQRARELAKEHRSRGDALGWFEKLYVEAQGNAEHVPWADDEPHPLLADWLARERIEAGGGDGGASPALRRALVIGAGLGDDAEGLARAGFAVTAFDLSPTAIEWCRRRFPSSRVDYRVADLFAAPVEWQGAFDLVFECYTLQALPLGVRERAFEPIARFVARGGTLLVVTRGTDAHENVDELPLPLTPAELARFEHLGLARTDWLDVVTGEQLPLRRFRAVYRR
ncbi:MAG: class I SAM-dependent methyltransferase [Planctomycetes bacterium]|nr:class I SAM-dependent methyltransferase [Planctomycetota bacterium]